MNEQIPHTNAPKILRLPSFDLTRLLSDPAAEPYLNHDQDTTPNPSCPLDLGGVESYQEGGVGDTTDSIEGEAELPPCPSLSTEVHPQHPTQPTSTPPSPTPYLTYEERRKKKKNQRKRKRDPESEQAKKRRRDMELKSRTRAQQVLTDINIADLPSAKAGFRGVGVGPERRTDWTLVPREDGSPITLLVDSHHRVFAVRVTPSGTPTLPDFARGLLSAVEKLAASRQKGVSSCPTGNYRTCTLGISYGEGQVKPQYLTDICDEAALKEYLENNYVQTCVRHIKKIFHTWSPRLFHYYEQTASELEEKEGLKPLFPNLPFLASTLNIGPHAITDDGHKDFENLQFGLSAIVALGEFDSKKGGRLRLEEVGIELEFAPGDVVLVPSAVITLYNTDIGETETCSSVTFYTAGQLFRWVHNECQPVKNLSDAEEKRDIRNTDMNLEQGWGMYLTTEDISNSFTCPVCY